MSVDAFDTFSAAYEAMIDWKKRLANEEPLYRWLFDRIGARSIVDVACGTGHHAAMFRSWGLRVEGADLSDAMIRACRQRHGESDDLRWSVRGFDRSPQRPGAFDVALCAGNSLALAPDRASVRAAIAQMLAAVRPGGAILAHVLNLWRLADGPCQWQKCIRAPLPEGESLIIKGVHRAGDRGYVDLLVTRLADATLRSECAAFLGLEASDLSDMARAAGAGSVEVYGDYQRRAYERKTSADLILVGIK